MNTDKSGISSALQNANNTMDSNAGITMDNGEAKVTSGLQDADTSGRSLTEAAIPVTMSIGQTFDTSQSGAVVLGEENKTESNEMVFTVVAVDNNINELIQSTFNDVGLSKGVQLSLVPRSTDNITSTINTDDVQLTSAQNCAPFNQLALIASTIQQSSQTEESQEFLTQSKDGEKSPSFNESLDEDSEINKDDSRIDDSSEKKLRVCCSVCEQDFSDLPSMRRHRLIHSEDKPFQCEFCDKAFRRKDNLREHRNIHTLENVYSCTRCGKTFPRKYTHKVHMARFCNKEKPSSNSRKDDDDVWGGQLSTATKTTPSSLAIKTSSTKTSASNNKSSDPCHICFKTFRDSSTLKRHLLTHSDDRPFKCDQCNKSFRRKDHLQEHVIVHNEVRPFPCPQCGKSFSRKNGLKTHMIRTLHGQGFKVSTSKCTMISNNVTHSLINHTQDTDIDDLTEAQESNHEFNKISPSNQVLLNKVTERSTNKINEDGDISMDLDFSEVNLGSQNPGGTSGMISESTSIMDGSKQTEMTVVLSDKNGETANVGGNGSGVSRNNAPDFREFGASTLSTNGSSMVIADALNKKVSDAQEKEHETKCCEVINTDTQFQNDSLHKHEETMPEHGGSQSEDITSVENLEDRSEMELDGVLEGQGSSNDDSVETTGKDVITIKGICICSVCDKQFRDATALRRHSLVHSGERPHACTQCGKRFRRRDHLKSHVNAYHCGTTKFNCRNCDMIFNNRHSLSIHHKSCNNGLRPQTTTTNTNKLHGNTESKSCPICHKTFKDPSTQKRHLRVHSEERPFHCDLCPKSFRRKDNLKEHMLCHSDQKPFACDDCGKALSRRSSLTNHRSICPMNLSRLDATASSMVNTTTLPNMNFAETSTKDAEVCMNNDPEEDDDEPLEDDTRELRDGDDGDLGDGDGDVGDGNLGDGKGLSCNQCGKVFRAKWTLKYHERVHTGEKPYTCLTCDRQFRQPGHLKIHERTHSGERPYACDACGRAFIDSSTLRRHTRVHKDTVYDAEETIQESSEGTAVQHNEGVDGDHIQIAVPSSDGGATSSQPSSGNIVAGVKPPDESPAERASESHVGEMATPKIATLNWQQNPQQNLQDQITYLSNCKATEQMSENIAK